MVNVSPLYDKVLLVKQTINSVSSSPLIEYVNLNFIYKIETESGANQFYSAICKDIDGYCDKILENIEDINSMRALKECYSEAFMFSVLNSRLNISPVGRARGSKTPDFLVNFKNTDLFIEMKSMSMLNGNLIYNGIMEDSLVAKVVAESQIRDGKKVGVGEHEVQPYYKGQQSYSPYSSLIPIEAIIGKLNQNIKSDQFSHG